jgi:flagellar biosynthesis GTPase FlhF
MELINKMILNLRTFFTILFSLLLIVTFTYAEIFKWVDEKGTVHFTEDPSTIPEKYRDSIKSRTTEEDLMSPEERIELKKKAEEEVRKRQEKRDTEYKKSIREEEKRKKAKEEEYATEERRIRVEKEEEARKAEQSKREPEPEYVSDPCLYCGGSGIIWKKARFLKKDCSHCPSRWEEEQKATKCENCNGKGFTMRRVK